MNLSPREKEVLRLLSQGKTNKEIATVLTITQDTVKSHLKNILEKLHLENRLQAVAHAVREGLINNTPGQLVVLDLKHNNAIIYNRQRILSMRKEDLVKAIHGEARP